MKTLLMATCASLALAVPAHADGLVSINWGLGYFADSGVSTVDKLERGEIASTNIKGIEAGYDGGGWRVTAGLEHTDADGDWGVHQPNGDLARQTVQISATRFVLGGEYDLPISIGALKPFVGAGISLNMNRPENSTIIDLAGGGQRGCVSDNGDTYSFGYHGRLGLGYDIGNARVGIFGQYTDRGTAKTGCDNGVDRYENYTVALKDFSVRAAFSVRW